MKLRSKLSIDLRGRKPMPERKLTKDIDQLIAENERFNNILERSGNTSRGIKGHIADEFFDTAVDIFGDTLRTGVATFIPVAADIGFALKNINEIKKSSDYGKELIILYNEEDSYTTLGGSYLNKIDDVLDDIITDISDTIESLISIIPVGGDAAGIIATVTSWVNKIKNMLGPLINQLNKVPGSKSKLGKKMTERLFANTALRTAIFKLDEKFDSGTTFWGAMFESVKVAGTLTDIVSNFDVLYEMSNDEYENLSNKDKLALIVKARTQKRFVHIPKSIDDIEPSLYGFETVVDKNGELINLDKDSNMSELKIRNLISQILSESEELIDEDLVENDKEVEEASVAGSIGGYAGPMSSPANPKNFYKRMLKSYPGSHYVNDLPKSKS